MIKGRFFMHQRIIRFNTRPVFYSTIKIPGKHFLDYADTSIKSLPLAYKPLQFEDGWYDWWEAQGYFKPRDTGQPYTLILPPPNVTGNLHLGHALTATLQDVLVRWRRMHGDSVLWIPGTDHAGIATQVVVEKYLQKHKNLSKFDLGREKFIDEVWNWKAEKGDHIIRQLRALGSSLDWSRLTFTMDSIPSAAVKDAFIKLFDKGLIYRRDALVNWSCALQSSISDIEVESLAISGPTLINVPGCDQPVSFGVLYDIAYPLHNQDGEVLVATTRPETVLGDTAIALHPTDHRRSFLEGKQVWHPLRRTPIPIVFDDLVDPEFGTGALKITPAHDVNDFEVARRHGLEVIQIFDESGRIIIGNSLGKQRYEARAEILDSLQNCGSLRGSKDHKMVVPICSRSGDVVEQMLKPQWFLNCSNAADRAVKAVEDGRLMILPDNYRRVWKHWLGHIKDWNISRQLWWGHRIPAYHVTNGSRQAWIAANDSHEAILKASKQWSVAAEGITARADEDVLDTWFSSSLHPFYGVNPDTQRLPLSLLETGHDIIFFWVARMVMISLMLTGELPFTNVVLHGVICDAHGHKMSKSLGNAVSPEQVVHGASVQEMTESLHRAHRSGFITDQQLTQSLAGQRKLFPDGIPECGTDALRLTLCSQDIQCSNISFDVTTCHTNKLFCNKILQAFRFAFMCLDRVEAESPTYEIDVAHCNGFDKWILSRLAATVDILDTSLVDYQFHLATQTLRNFLYCELCDVYIETVKTVLKEGNPLQQKTSVYCLINCLDVGIRLLHPFMPYMTEELYQRLPPPLRRSDSIMIASYPKTMDWIQWRNSAIEFQHARVQDIVTALRKLKALYGSKGDKPEVVIVCDNEDVIQFINDNSNIVKALAKVGELTVMAHFDSPDAHFVKEVLDDRTAVYSHLPNNASLRLKRLEPILKKEQKLRKQIDKLQSLLLDPGKKLSPEVRDKIMRSSSSLQSQLKKVLANKENL